MNALLAALCLSASFAAVSATGYTTCRPPVMGKNQVYSPELEWYVPTFNRNDEVTVTCSGKDLYLYDSDAKEYVRGNKLILTCLGADKYKPSWTVGIYICKKRETPCALSVKPPLIATPANQNLFARGDEVSFECAGDYYLSGVDKLKCGRNGKWNHAIPICLPMCKKPSRKYLVVEDEGEDSYKADGSITLSCEKYYRLTGRSRRYCESDGKWDPEIEDKPCYRTGCPPPPKFNKGSYSPGPGKDNWYEEGERITYKCTYDNYYLEGKPQRICTYKGVFIYGEPKCIEIRCDRPMNIKNGDYEDKKDDYAVDDFVTYTCDEKYRLSTRSGKRTCVKTGTKTAEFEEAPSCIRIKCDKPKTIKDGTFTPKQTNYYVDDKVTYKCDDDFYLDGDAEIKCLLNDDGLTAQFEEAPECQPIKCDRPMPPDMGSFTPDRKEYLLHRTITFECVTNYYLVGPEKATCVEDTRTKGKFTEIPRCREVRCKKPMVPSNGKITPSETSYPVGDDITYSCDKNYRLEPKDGDRTCTLNPDKKTASFGRGAKCVEILCDEPMNIDNGDFVTEPEEPYTVGTVVRYKCDYGYKFSTKFTTSTCELQDDERSAKFSKRPSCERIYCNNPGKPDNGDITEDKTQYVVDESVTWSCDDCYKLDGAVTATCRTNGKFDKPVPTCKLRKCSKKAIVAYENAFFSPKQKEYDCGQTITYKCHSDKYRLTGNNKAKCLPDGSFSPLNLRCELITCNRPKLNKFVRVVQDQDVYVVGTEITYSCKGYNTPNTDKLTAVCQRDGTFSRKSPICIPIKCGRPPVPDNGEIIDYDEDKEKYSPYETVEYKCDKYYTLDGDDTNVCQLNGKWQNNAPTCRPPVCKNNCHLKEIYGRPCQCNPGCRRKKNCCKDYIDECYKKSCKERCGEKVPGGCSCMSDCSTKGGFHCCRDYLTACPGEWYLF